MPLEEGSTDLKNQYLEAHLSMLFINEHVVELSVILEVLKCGALKEDLALNLV